MVDPGKINPMPIVVSKRAAKKAIQDAYIANKGRILGASALSEGIISAGSDYQGLIDEGVKSTKAALPSIAAGAAVSLINLGLGHSPLGDAITKFVTKDAEEIVLTNNLSQVHLIAEKHDGNLQVAINRLIDSSASYLEAHEKKHIDPNNNIWLYIGNHEVYLSKRQTLKINQAIQDKLDEYWAENQTEDEKEATRAEGLWEMNEGR